jgi:hypothetical protein
MRFSKTKSFDYFVAAQMATAPYLSHCTVCTVYCIVLKTSRFSKMQQSKKLPVTICSKTDNSFSVIHIGILNLQ